jgi:hypothetical protein
VPDGPPPGYTIEALEKERRKGERKRRERFDEEDFTNKRTL